MCLPFICGGGGDRDRDHGSPAHSGNQHPPPAHHPLSPPPRYVTPSPVNGSYDHRTPRMAASGEARNGGAEAAPWHVPGVNKNGERVMGFDTTHAGVGAPVTGVHGHGSVPAASYPKESPDRTMRAPPVAQMARRRGAEDNYPAAVAAAATTPSPPVANNFYGGHGHGHDYAAAAAAATAAATTRSPVANNFYGGHGHGYDGTYAYGDRDRHNRNTQGNSLW